MRLFVFILLIGIAFLGVNQAQCINKDKLHEQLQQLENSVFKFIIKYFSQGKITKDLLKRARFLYSRGVADERNKIDEITSELISEQGTSY